MDIKVSITDKQVADLLCSAFEGGSNYWIHHIETHVKGVDGKPWGEEYTPSYIKAPFSSKGYVEIDPGEGEPKVKLDTHALVRGCEIFAREYPQHFADALSESNADATTGDVFLQCCLFGKVIFG